MNLSQIALPRAKVSFTGIAQGARRLLSRVYKPAHHASYKPEEGISLRELFQSRIISRRLFDMETLYEEKTYLSDGKVEVFAILRFGYFEARFEAGDGRLMLPGSIISARFILGTGKDDFTIEGGVGDEFPKEFLLFWREKYGPGIISAKLSS